MELQMNQTLQATENRGPESQIDSSSPSAEDHAMQTPDKGKGEDTASVAYDDEGAEAEGGIFVTSEEWCFLSVCCQMLITCITPTSGNDATSAKQVSHADVDKIRLNIACGLHNILFALRGGDDIIALQVSICRICEVWWTSEKAGAELLVPQMLPFLLLRSLDMGATQADIKRIHAVRSAFLLLDYEDISADSVSTPPPPLPFLSTFLFTAPVHRFHNLLRVNPLPKWHALTHNATHTHLWHAQLKMMLMKCMMHPLFLRGVEGRKLLVFVMGMHPSFTIDLHRSVKTQVRRPPLPPSLPSPSCILFSSRSGQNGDGDIHPVL
jgi:hypothetical protein